MPGPNRAPRGGYAKPKNMGRTIRRLAGYLTRSKLPLLMVLLLLALGSLLLQGMNQQQRSLLAQVSAETINPAHPASQFSGGNLDTLSDKPGSPVLDALHAFRDRWYSANLMKAVIYSNKPLPELPPRPTGGCLIMTSASRRLPYRS